MNFSGEDRKEVFFFFEEILRLCKQPVYYENLRGYVSKASVNVRKYVLTKCKGDNFLEYFKRRKNYFNLEDGKISLKEEFGNEQLGNSCSNKTKKKNSKGKFVRRSSAFPYSSYASALRGSDLNKNEEKVYETVAITYFRNRFVRKKKERLWAIEVSDLPKKVKRHLQLYHQNKVKNFLSEYPDKFVIDSDDETVSLAHVSTNTIDSSADQVPSRDLNQNFVKDSEIIVDSEIKTAVEYFECVVFFSDILKKLNRPFPISQLGGYFSQAKKDIRDHVKINYRGFKYFFDDAPLIFFKNSSGELTLSKDYKKLIKAAENLIKEAKNGLISPGEKPLKSRICHIFQPHISSQHFSSIIEKTNSNNEVLPSKNMANAHADINEEILKLHCSNQLESELLHEATDDFFDNYLMHSTSRESSISLSSKSTPSISGENLQVGDFSDSKIMENFVSNTKQGFNDKEMENIFLKCILTVELFCLEFVESELNYIQSYENIAVEYFMEILNCSSTKSWRLTSLQGSIGNNREIAQFMNKLYKGEKFVSFFERHSQFEVDLPFVKVALFDKTNCTKDSALCSNEKNLIEDLKDLYELDDFKTLLKETYVYLYNVCEFCKGKDEVKIDRLSGILPRFRSCFNMIKSLRGQILSEKIEHFLHETMLFQFPKKGSVFFPYEMFYKGQILFEWLEKMECTNSSQEVVSFSDFWTINVYSRYVSNKNIKIFNGYINLEECYQNVVDIIEKEIESRFELSYLELPKIISECVLFSLTNGDYYSRPFISALLESGNFRMKNGKISLQKTSEDYNLFSSDNKHNESTENLNKQENPISEESSNGLYTQQIYNDGNLINNSFSSSLNSNNIISTHSEVSQTKFRSNQSSNILQTMECCETKEMDAKSVEFNSNIFFKNDKMSSNFPLLSHGQKENFNSMNENHESFVQESERNENLFNTEENLLSDIELNDAENLNLTEETVVHTKISKSLLSYKTLDLAEKESEHIDESSIKYYECKNKVISKADSPLHNSDVENLKVPSQFLPPELFESEESTKDSTDLLTSKDLNEQKNEFVNDLILPSQDLNTNYIAPLKEKCSVSCASKIKSLDINSLTKNNTKLEAANKKGVESNTKTSKVEQNSNESFDAKIEMKNVESNIKTSKMEQNISFMPEDEMSSKLGVGLLGKKNTNDRVDAKIEMTNAESYSKASKVEKKFCFTSDDNSSKFGINLLSKQNPNESVDAKIEINNAESDIKVSKLEQNISFMSEDVKSSKLGINLHKKNTNDSVDAKIKITNDAHFNNSELPNEDTITKVFEQSDERNRNLNNCKTFEQTGENSFQNIPQVSGFNDTIIETRVFAPDQDFKKIQDSYQLQVLSKNANISYEQSFSYIPEELFDTSLIKLYLTFENVAEERNSSLTRHDLESVKQTAAEEKHEISSISTSPQNENSEINISSSCNDLTSEYPMQPITARVVLLTNNSCIALADIKKCKKSIYFLKYAFTCEHQDDCSECFSTLKIDDEVSCFVPLTELSQKIWIAFMVTKDNSDNLREFDIFGKLNENAKAICDGSMKPLSITTKIKSSAHHFGCQTEFSKSDNHSQTDFNFDLDLYKATKETCQTRSISVQTENWAMTCVTGPGNAVTPLNRNSAKSQTYLNGDFEKNVMSENATCHNSWLGEIPLTNNVSCQTFSTGAIIMVKHHPM